MEDIIKVLVYGYFTKANCKYFKKIFVLFLHYYDGIMSDNTESEVMLYFTDEVFRRLANQNRGHGIFYKAGLR